MTQIMNRIVAILTVVLLLTTGGIFALLNHERNTATARLAEAEVTQKKLESELADLRTERDSLRKKLQKQAQTATEVSLAATPGPPESATPAGTLSKPGDKPSDSIATPAKTKNSLAEMSKNTAMKQWQNSWLDLQYDSLFSKFNLSEEEKGDFKQLLADRLQRESKLRYQLRDASSPEQRAALVKDFQDSQNASDMRIRDFLNNDTDFTAYKNWEDTKAERRQFDIGRSLFTSSGEPLTSQQEAQIISVMQQVRQQLSTVPDLSKPENFGLPQANTDQRRLDFETSAAAIAAQAGQFLSPRQLETLNAMLLQSHTISEARLNRGSRGP